MYMEMIAEAGLAKLQEVFGESFQENVSLKRYSAARLGGNADYLLTVRSADELSQAASLCWQNDLSFLILGSGSNVLVSDKGVRQLVVLNQAKKIAFEMEPEPVRVFAESGSNFGALARKAASRGLSGLEWAAAIPGTVGGAVYGNAGAHGSDMSDSLLVANILHLKTSKNGIRDEIVTEEWQADRFEYGYRSSSLKRQPGSWVVLSATLKLSRSTPEEVQAKMDEYRMMRQGSQPSGASLGSIFKNPAGDHAGRLIEAAGLKGKRIGNVEVSPVHANFFVNLGEASASDYAALIRVVQQEVLAKLGVELELEIEMIGDWSEQ
jgi:UDP-N-acetylmuramate dehydrogenase